MGTASDGNEEEEEDDNDDEGEGEGEGVAEAVSLESLEGSTVPVALLCNHVFHDGCIQQWLQQTRRSDSSPPPLLKTNKMVFCL